MALIVDPDDLNQGTEVTITTGTRLVTLNIAGNLSNDGVTLQALYSFFKEEWKTDAALIPHPFPQVAITPEQFEWIEDWKPFNDATRKLIRTGGWKEIDENDVLQKEWATKHTSNKAMILLIQVPHRTLTWLDLSMKPLKYMTM
jgi:hypothetical protein